VFKKKKKKKKRDSLSFSVSQITLRKYFLNGEVIEERREREREGNRKKERKRK